MSYPPPHLRFGQPLGTSDLRLSTAPGSEDPEAAREGGHRQDAPGPVLRASEGRRWRAALARCPQSARAAPRLHVLPARPGAVLVGDTRALPLPVPARTPLLARIGVLACEAVFSSRRLAAPIVAPYSFRRRKLPAMIETTSRKNR